MVTTTEIALDQIETPRKWRVVKKTAVAALADSMDDDGLLQPIGVRPHPTKPAVYILVWGKHRLEAARKLGWGTIDARVMIFGDDADSGLATIAENLFRNNLSTAERVISFKTWRESYLERHPEASERRAPVEARRRKREGDESEPTPGFAAMASDQTGIPEKTVKSYITAGSKLTDEQLGILAGDSRIGITDIAAINKLPDDQRGQAVSLVAAGVGPKVAVAQAQLPPNTTVEEVGDMTEAECLEDEMTDERWLETYCGEVLVRLKFQKDYREDAILYRKSREARQVFRGSMKNLLKQSKIQGNGSFRYWLTRVVNADHPANWNPCGVCGATGYTPHGKCTHCHGNAYVVKTAAGRK